MSFSSAPRPDQEPGHNHSLTCLFEIANYLDFDLSFLGNQQWHICPSNDISSVSNYLLQWCIYPFMLQP